MNYKVVMLLCAASAACASGSVRAADQRDLAAEVRAVFSARCAACHGPDLAKPKGRFGYVLDLARVASNPEMVVPSSLDESELWELVQRGDMPPADSPTGALTARQKETIREWIAAGAPAESSTARDSQPPPLPGEVVAAAPTTGRRFVLWLGKFHLLVLHFPIALLAAAALAESWSLYQRSRVPAPAVRFCTLLGAVSAVVAAALGWLHALGGYGMGMPGILSLHRWLGTAAGLWVVVAVVFSERDSRRGKRCWITSALLFGGALLIGVTAHFGGMLVRGKDFLDW